MKKLITVLTFALFTSAMAMPAHARGYGMGRGGVMMGGQGSGSLYCDQGGRFYRGSKQSDRGQFYREPEAQSVLTERSGREYQGDPNSSERRGDRYNTYGHMGGFGMGWWR